MVYAVVKLPESIPNCKSPESASYKILIILPLEKSLRKHKVPTVAVSDYIKMVAEQITQ